MSSRREIVSVYTGRSGARFVVPNYQLFGEEHEICPSLGKMDDNRPSVANRFDYVFYSDRYQGKFAARAVVGDLEPSCTNHVRQKFGLMFPRQWVTGTKDAQMNFARGRYSMGPYLIDLMVDEVRLQAELCDNLQGFLFHHSLGGGTGSGFTALLLEKLAQDYPKKSKLQFATYSTSLFQLRKEETYNAILHTHATSDLTDCVFMLDNSVMARKLLQCYGGFYDLKPSHLNHLIAEVVSSITSSLRFDMGIRIHETLDDIVRNMVVLPRMRHPLVSLSPLSPEEDCKNGKFRLDVRCLIVGCYSTKNALLNIDPRFGKIMSCAWLFRGDVQPVDVNRTVNMIGRLKDIQWARYGDRGCFKWGIHPISNSTLCGSLIPTVRRHLCMLQNNTATIGVWHNLYREYNQLLSNKTSMHRYLAEGMDEGEFAAAKDNLERIMKELRMVHEQ